MAAKPPQLVADLHAPRAGDCLNIDVIRCRYSAFVDANEHDLPIFAPTDEILSAEEGQLADFTWVHQGDMKSMRTALPPPSSSLALGRAKTCVRASLQKRAGISRPFHEASNPPSRWCPPR